MKRPAASAKTLERVQAWRRECPELTLRSTFIVGFPGETEAEFEELLGFLDAAQLDRVGAFAYSPVDGAKANELPDAVSEEIKQERLERFMAAQARISAQRLQRKIGSTLRALVDQVDQDGAIARTPADAPEIDGVLRIVDGHKLKPGQFVDVRIDAADEHDLSGSLRV
jgi:ribosomal protein S12 methylthiotransferase